MLVNALLLLLTEILLILCGLAFLRVLQKGSPDLLPDLASIPLPLIAILGLIGSTFLTAVLSIFIRINGEVFAGLVALLLGYTILDRTWIRVYLYKLLTFSWRQNVSSLLLFGLLFALVLATSADPDRSYDDGLYHIQSVLLITQHQGIPGLGLLHNRFAYNSIWHISSALWGYPFLNPAQQLFFIITPLLMLNFTAFLLGGLKKEKRWPLQGISLLLLAISTAYMVYYRFDFGAVDNNLPSFILVWLIMLIFIRTMFQPAKATSDVQNTLLILLMVIFAWMVKISTLMLMVPAGYLFLTLWKNQRAEMLKIFALSFVLLLPWVARSLLTSGFFIYPPLTPWFGLPFKWQMPFAMARENALVDISWAKIPGASAQAVSELSLTEWLPQWFQSLDRNEILLIGAVILAFTLFAFSLICNLKKLGLQAILPQSLLLLGWMLASLVFWFFSYPDPRFLYGPAMPIVASLFLSLSFWLPEPKQTTSPALMHGGILFTTLLLALLFVRLNILSEIDYSNIQLQPAPLPQVEVRQVPMNGFNLTLPVSGDQCWGSAVPCIPDKCSKAVHLLGKTVWDGFIFKK